MSHKELSTMSDSWEYRFICSSCSQDFDSPAALERHERTLHGGSGERPWKCDIAGCAANVLSWNSKNGLRKHKKEWHGPYVCSAPGCSRTTPNGFGNGESLELHVATHHPPITVPVGDIGQTRDQGITRESPLEYIPTEPTFPPRLSEAGEVNHASSSAPVQRENLATTQRRSSTNFSSRDNRVAKNTRDAVSSPLRNDQTAALTHNFLPFPQLQVPPGSVQRSYSLSSQADEPRSLSTPQLYSTLNNYWPAGDDTDPLYGPVEITQRVNSHSPLLHHSPTRYQSPGGNCNSHHPPPPVDQLARLYHPSTYAPQRSSSVGETDPSSHFRAPGDGSERLDHASIASDPMSYLYPPPAPPQNNSLQTAHTPRSHIYQPDIPYLSWGSNQNQGQDSSSDSQGNSDAPKHAITRLSDMNEEPLDSDCRVNPSWAFRLGGVFKTLWAEPGGTTYNSDGSGATAPKRSVVHQKVRRFIIMRSLRGHAICIPVSTYGGRGTKKAGVHAEDHAIIYNYEARPYISPGEASLTNPPISFTPFAKHHLLDKNSRINFTKVYTIENNIRVCFIGIISPESLPQLVQTYNKLNPPLAEP